MFGDIRDSASPESVADPWPGRAVMAAFATGTTPPTEGHPVRREWHQFRREECAPSDHPDVRFPMPSAPNTASKMGGADGGYSISVREA